ncbi:alpha/beta fold hydrolase, partial [Escherichia coli]|uniref:alpha/beta fold hydrolase n=1 Tax=Escherichia coli TaxID=562 RepID=UPI003CE45E38
LRRLVAGVARDQPVVLIGNSYGGLLALNFALIYPELVLSLVLVDAQINDAAWKASMRHSLGQTGRGAQRLIEESFQHWL